MDAATVVLDTNVLIDFLRGKAPIRSLLRELAGRGSTLAISAITVGELYAGMRPKERPATDTLISALDCLPVTVEIAQKAGMIRASQRSLGKTFTLDDMVIAATAIQNGFPLLTGNRKDFDIPGILLYEP